MEELTKRINEIKNKQITGKELIEISSNLKDCKFDELVIPESDIEIRKRLDEINNQVFSLLGFRENLINKLNEDKEDEIENDKEWDPIDFYKNVKKRDIASALGHAQRAHVKASNKAYALKKIIRELIVSTQDDFNLSKACYNKPGIDDDLKNAFMGEMLAYQKTLSTLQLIDLGEDNEK